MTAAWIMLAIDRALPNLTGGERDRVAREVIDSIPPEPIALAIRESISVVLKQRGIRDEGDELARELANNSAQSVLFVLAGFDEEPLTEDDVRDALAVGAHERNLAERTLKRAPRR